jgi:hypothetical protein
VPHTEQGDISVASPSEFRQFGIELREAGVKSRAQFFSLKCSRTDAEAILVHVGNRHDDSSRPTRCVYTHRDEQAALALHIIDEASPDMDTDLAQDRAGCLKPRGRVVIPSNHDDITDWTVTQARQEPIPELEGLRRGVVLVKNVSRNEEDIDGLLPESSTQPGEEQVMVFSPRHSFVGDAEMPIRSVKDS